MAHHCKIYRTKHFPNNYSEYSPSKKKCKCQLYYLHMYTEYRNMHFRSPGSYE